MSEVPLQSNAPPKAAAGGFGRAGSDFNFLLNSLSVSLSDCLCVSVYVSLTVSVYLCLCVYLCL